MLPKTSQILSKISSYFLSSDVESTTKWTKIVNQATAYREVSYLMIRQWFLLEWRETGPAHMSIKQGVQDGPIWEKPLESFRVLMRRAPENNRLSSEGLAGCLTNIALANHLPCIIAYVQLLHPRVARMFATDTQPISERFFCATIPSLLHH